MIDHTQRLIAIALMAAIIGAVSSCHSEEAQPLTIQTPSVQTPSVHTPPPLPMRSLQTSPHPSSLVGTVPITRADERAITPAETVGAASN